MKLAPQLETFRGMCAGYAATHRFTCADILTGRDAWTVAHRSGALSAAYGLGRDITDAHIQTALERIFPNAVFRDAKRY